MLMVMKVISDQQNAIEKWVVADLTRHTADIEHQYELRYHAEVEALKDPVMKWWHLSKLIMVA